MNERILEIIEGAGRLAELTKIQYDAFLRVGFNETQALSLASRLMEVTILDSLQNRREEEG